MTRTIILTEELESLQLRTRIRNRDNIGGTRIEQMDGQTNGLIEDVPEPYLDPWCIADRYFSAMLQYICLPVNSPLHRAVQSVTKWIERVVEKSTFRDPMNVTARTRDSGLNGASIVARYISHGLPAVSQLED